jgi:tetratricopeptide (TPR) repeat protein
MNKSPSCLPPNFCRSFMLPIGVAMITAVAGFAQSTDPYTDKLKTGDAKTQSGDFAGAAADYEAAFLDAKTPTQSALALGKKAQSLVQTKDFPAAREAADRALGSGGSIEPVAEVTVLQALAKCQLEAKDYAGALDSMTRAGALIGVDWAKPELAMIRGDAERGVGNAEAALISYRSVLDMPGVSDDFKGVAWLNVGLAEQYSLKNGANAKEAYAKAVELNPALKAEIETHVAKIQ